MICRTLNNMHSILTQRFRTIAECGSEDFDDFLGVLGEQITLKGWERFRGGLDVKGMSLEL